LYGIPAADYPQLRTIKDDKKIVIDQDKLKGMLKKTGFSASQEEGRYVLNGTYIEFKEHKIVVVATDGRRLALVEEDYDVPENAKGGIIVPVKAVNELNRLLNEKGTVEVNFIENFVKFKLNNEEGSPIQIFTKLIEGAFPNYRQVVPTESKYRIEIYREEFLGALKRAELVTSERQSSVKLSFTQNQLTITTNTPEVGDFLETVAVRFSGEDFSVAFNPAFLIEPLSVLTEDVIFFELTDHMSPGVVKTNGPFLYVVMPMRLQE
jgi:DNA polymerase-3 subunit beta